MEGETNTKQAIMAELKIGEYIYDAFERMTFQEANESLTDDGKNKWMRIHNSSDDRYQRDSNGVIKEKSMI